MNNKKFGVGTGKIELYKGENKIYEGNVHNVEVGGTDSRLNQVPALEYLQHKMLDNSTFTDFFKTIEPIKNKKHEVKKVIYNNPATVVEFMNGDKVVVKATDGDSFDPIYGFLLAFYEQISGNSKNVNNKFFNGLRKQYSESVRKSIIKGQKKLEKK